MSSRSSQYDARREHSRSFTLLLIIVADVLQGVTHDLLVVDLSLGGDLTEDHDHASLGASLASHLGLGVLLQARIQHSVGYLIAQLVCTYVSTIHEHGSKSRRACHPSSSNMSKLTSAAHFCAMSTHIPG